MPFAPILWKKYPNNIWESILISDLLISGMIKNDQNSNWINRQFTISRFKCNVLFDLYIFNAHYCTRKCTAMSVAGTNNSTNYNSINWCNVQCACACFHILNVLTLFGICFSTIRPTKNGICAFYECDNTHKWSHRPHTKSKSSIQMAEIGFIFFLFQLMLRTVEYNICVLFAKFSQCRMQWIK